MLRKMAYTFSFLTVAMLGTHATAHAFSPESLPVIQSSDRWEVKIDSPDDQKHPDMIKSQKGVYNTYSLKLKDLQKDVYNLKVEVYRDEPNSKTKYELFTNNNPLFKSGQEIQLHANFPISVKAEELEVTITWQEEPHITLKNGQKADARRYKQVFKFTDQ